METSNCSVKSGGVWCCKKCERWALGEVYKVSINFIWRRQELNLGQANNFLIIKYGREPGNFGAGGTRPRAIQEGEGPGDWKGKAAERE